MHLRAQPRVTVLLPFHNALPTLEECLASVRAQSLTELELLGVDDGSQDGSADLFRAHAAVDPRLRLLSPGRVGLVAALNLGLEQARAPLVARMDADDRMHPQRLARQLEYLQRHRAVDVAGCRVRPFPAEQVRGGLTEYLRWQDRCLSPGQMARAIYREAPLVHPTAMMRRAPVLAAGGYRQGGFPEDYELWLRLVHAGRRLGKVDEALLHWRVGPDTLSRTDPRYSREAFDRLRAEYLARDPRLGQGRPLVVWGAGRRTRRRARHLLERGHRVQAWVDIDPRKLGQRLAGVPVVEPGWLAGQPRSLVLIYVASHGAPELAAGALVDMGYRPGQDFLIVG